MLWVTFDSVTGAHLAASPTDPGRASKDAPPVAEVHRDFGSWNPATDWDPVARAPKPLPPPDPPYPTKADTLPLLKKIAEDVADIKARLAGMGV